MPTDPCPTCPELESSYLDSEPGLDSWHCTECGADYSVAVTEHGTN